MKRRRLKFDPNGIRKVGKFYENAMRHFSYMDVKFDEDKWADAFKFLPADYDLCYCKIEGRDKTYPGWHTGIHWDGANIKKYDKISFWRLNYSF